VSLSSATAESLPPETTPPRITRIEPARGWIPLKFDELWEYRELFYFLTWRDIKVRYKQTLLGASWAIIQPLCTMLVFTLFFGNLAGVPSDGIPYPIFSFAALVPWTFFANALSTSSLSLVQGSNLLKKVYFPRLALPVSTILGGVVDFMLSFAVLILMMLFFGILPTWRVIFLPPLLLLAFITSLGVGLWLSAINVRYRDVRYTVPFLVQLWMFATPVAYPSSMLAEPWRTVYGINPMVGVVEGFRWALLDTGQPSPAPAVSDRTEVVISDGDAEVRIGHSDNRYYQQIIHQTDNGESVSDVELTAAQYDTLTKAAAAAVETEQQVTGTPAPGPMIVVSSLVGVLLLISGTFYFRRMEKTFADVV